MKTVVFLLFVYVLLILNVNGSSLRTKRSTFGRTKCGVQDENLKPDLRAKRRIIGGRDAKKNSWPWLLILRYINGNTYGDCAMNLIRVNDALDESDIAITAAHCVTVAKGIVAEPLSPEKLSVRAGAHNRKVPDNIEEMRGVADFVAHPGYAYNWTRHDIAVVKLDKPLKFSSIIKPICLPEKTAETPIELECVAAGWGLTDKMNKRFPTVLQQAIFPVKMDEYCRMGWPTHFDKDSMMCAGGPSSNGAVYACDGDSGGQLACHNRDNNEPWILYGVSSFGTKTCISSVAPTVFARVSAYLEFIEKTALALTSLKS